MTTAAPTGSPSTGDGAGGPTLVLLPGMDGTGELFGPLLEVIPPAVAVRVIRYPRNEHLTYDALLNRLEAELDSEGRVVLVAESFSGPLALRYAAVYPGRVRAVVLCASFVRAPLPRFLRWLVFPLLFRLPLPDAIVRRVLTGRSAPQTLVRAVKNAVRSVSPRVLAARLREVFHVDCSSALRDCGVPVLYLAPAQDALVGQSALKAILNVRPDVRVVKLVGPHLLLQQQAAAAWEAITSFAPALVRPA